MTQNAFSDPILPRWTPASMLDFEPYTLDFTAVLEGDAITGTPTVTVVGTIPETTVPPVVGAVATAGPAVVFWLSGGTPEYVYTVSISIVTSSGRQLTRSALLPVAEFR